MLDMYICNPLASSYYRYDTEVRIEELGAKGKNLSIWEIIQAQANSAP